MKLLIIIDIAAAAFLIAALMMLENDPVFLIIPNKLLITLLLSGLAFNLTVSYYFDNRPEKRIDFMVNRIIKKGKKGATKPVSKNKIEITGSINYKKTKQIIGELDWLEKDPLVSEIFILLCSPGGSGLASLAICRMMKACQKPINIVSGDACSAAAYILSCGTKGKRYILKDSEVMIHQSYSTLPKILAGSKRESTMDKILDCLLSENTGQPFSRIVEDTKKETYF
ncbi:ATP-dependent Clp protease proteolytic subunit, partial [Patescibacteria group bacterium]|nr:ATP-dependent Clp protease proteolytic subunit [Patescibacteria group bacterium]